MKATNTMSTDPLGGMTDRERRHYDSAMEWLNRAVAQFDNEDRDMGALAVEISRTHIQLASLLGSGLVELVGDTTDGVQ